MQLDNLAVRYGQKLRDQKWQLYLEHFPPRRGERILDLGVSAMDHLPNENYFLHRYPYPDQITAVGVHDLAPLEDVYPGVTFIRADGRKLPFRDGEFDVAHCNAVVEHVASEDQAQFLSELTRVARTGFVTTPNRWFPIDSHTRLPLAHWLPRPIMVRTFDLCGRPENGIWLLSTRRFRHLFPADVELRVKVQKIAGLPATITVLFGR